MKLLYAVILLCFSIGTTMACEKYFYSLPEAEIKIIMKNAENISEGDYIAIVVSKLGDKYKKIKTLDKKGNFLGYKYRYEIRIKEEGLSNEIHDEYIVIYCDTTDKIVSMVFIKHSAR